MKILHLLSQTQLTGAEAYANTLANWMIKNSHQVWIVSDEWHLQTRAHYIPRKIHPKSFINKVRNVFFLRKLIKENQIQIVHTHSRAAVRVAYWATWGLKSTVLVSSIHGRQHSSLSKKIFDQYGDLVLSVCKNAQNSLLIHFKMNPFKMKILQNPVDDERLTYKPQPIGPIFKIALAGRFSGPKKIRMQDWLKYNLDQLLIEHSNFNLEVIGCLFEDLESELKNQIQTILNDDPDRIKFHNSIHPLDSYLTKFNLVIGSGRIAIESMMQGIPTIALGEYTYEGPMILETLDKAIESNFGDIGIENRDQSIDWKVISNETCDYISKIKNNSISTLEISLKIRDFFSLSKIGPQLIRNYESALFKKKFPAWIPILMYHMVVDQEIESKHRIFLTKNNFKKHLEFLKDNQFTTIHFKDLIQFRKKIAQGQTIEFPKKPIILTFDDGYKNNLENVLPLLEKYQMKIVLYLLADNEVEYNVWDKEEGTPQLPLLNKLERLKISQSKWVEIGSHGFRHDKLLNLTDNEAFNDIKNSKTTLEEELKIPIHSFAYTYGHRNENHVHFTEIAKYEYAVNTDQGGIHHEENPWSIFRVNIFPEDGIPQIKKKTSTWYRKYYLFKRGK